MKHSVRYQFLTIPTKVRCDVRIFVSDTEAEYVSTSTSGADSVTNLALNIHPFISISIIKPGIINEDGTRSRAPFNPNDTLSMTKYNLPIFIEELAGINNDMKIPELYTYHGKRLELNEEIAAKIRRVFMIGQTTLELSAVVIVQQDESRVEGIKMKYNNEDSSVLLTLNELNSLLFNLQHLDADNIGLSMYLGFIKNGTTSIVKPNTGFNKPIVDIEPPQSGLI